MKKEIMLSILVIIGLFLLTGVSISADLNPWVISIKEKSITENGKEYEIVFKEIYHQSPNEYYFIVLKEMEFYQLKREGTRLILTIKISDEDLKNLKFAYGVAFHTQSGAQVAYYAYPDETVVGYSGQEIPFMNLFCSEQILNVVNPAISLLLLE